MAQGKTKTSAGNAQHTGGTGAANEDLAENEAKSASNGGKPEDSLLDAVTRAAESSADECEGFVAPDRAEESVPEPSHQQAPPPVDIDPAEAEEWLESLRYVLESKGPER